MVHLRPSNRLAATALGREDMIARTASVQRMAFQEMAPLEELLVTLCATGFPAVADVIAENIGPTPFVELDVPIHGDLEETAGALACCLEQQ